MFRKSGKHAGSKKKKLVVIVVLVLGLLAGAAVGALALYRRGYIQLNHPSLKDYPVRGVDVSGFQRTIDWPRLVDGAKIDFAFIKASEGAQVQDRMYRQNWSAARGLVARSAYHFFTFCASGQTQATNFLDVLAQGSELPPAVDIEFSGNCTSYTSIAAVRAQLRIFLSTVRDATHRTPILYVTSQSFDRIVRGYFDNPLWVRDVVSAPISVDFPHLLFWQYAGNGRADGVRGLIDLNAFVGSKTQYRALIKTGVVPRR
jgi:lysozyme